MSQIVIARPKTRVVKCIKCGERFSHAHKCPSSPRQQTYTNTKAPETSKRKAGEQDDIKGPRKVPFDKATSRTTLRASKLAGASKQVSDPAGVSNVKRHRNFLKKLGRHG